MSKTLKCRSVCEPTNVHAQGLNRARDMATCNCLKLSLVPYSVRVNSKGSAENAEMHRFRCVFAICLCNKYPFHISLLKIYI